MTQQAIAEHQDLSRARWFEFCKDRSGANFVNFLDTLRGRNYAEEQPMLFSEPVLKELENSIREGELRASAPAIREAAINALANIPLHGTGPMDYGLEDALYAASVLQMIVRASTPDNLSQAQGTPELNVTFVDPARQPDVSVGG